MSDNRKHERLMGWAVVVLWAMLIGPSWALALPTLVIQNGILMGANHVDIGGSSYDVRFLDGSCISIYNGCDTDTDLTFLTSSAATMASQALMSQVFIDGIQGNFDSQAHLINGCGEPSGLPTGACRIATPFELLLASDAVRTSVAENFSVGLEPLDGIYQQTLVRFSNTVPGTDFVYAQWGISSNPDPVPEPSTYALLVSGLLGIAGYRWWLQSQA